MPQSILIAIPLPPALCLSCEPFSKVVARSGVQLCFEKPTLHPFGLHITDSVDCGSLHFLGSRLLESLLQR